MTNIIELHIIYGIKQTLKKNTEVIDKENRLVFARGREVSKWEKVIKGINF